MARIDGANPGGTSAGTGDVVGPGSSIDNNIPRFDGTTGKLLQASKMFESDTGILTFGGSITTNINNRVTLTYNNTTPTFGTAVRSGISLYIIGNNVNVGAPDYFARISNNNPPDDPSFAIHGKTEIGYDEFNGPDDFLLNIARTTGSETNYIMKSIDRFIIGSSTMYDTGTAVGVNTTSPVATFNIVGLSQSDSISSSGLNAQNVLAISGGGNGGGISSNTHGIAGNGGSIVIIGGAGGTISGAELIGSQFSGNGGTIRIVAGFGGTMRGSGTTGSWYGGSGGNLHLGAGVGGTVLSTTMSGVAINGPGGSIVIAAGNGGGILIGGSSIGGPGGNIYVMAGGGGDVFPPANNRGSGGFIVFLTSPRNFASQDERLIIDNQGRVGVGVMNASNSRASGTLHVTHRFSNSSNGEAHNYALIVDGTTNSLYMQSGGDIGLGNSLWYPEARIHISGESSQSAASLRVDTPSGIQSLVVYSGGLVHIGSAAGNKAFFNVQGQTPDSVDTGNATSATFFANFVAGSGGITYEPNSAVGGNGGSIVFTAGRAGAAISGTAGSRFGGNGGNFTLSAGLGGVTLSSEVDLEVGGSGGNFTISAGQGGIGGANGRAIGSIIGGKGGNISISAGIGGLSQTDTGSTSIGGSGGDITFTVGRAGGGDTDSGKGGRLLIVAPRSGTLAATTYTPVTIGAGNISFTPDQAFYVVGNARINALSVGSGDYINQVLTYITGLTFGNVVASSSVDITIGGVFGISGNEIVSITPAPNVMQGTNMNNGVFSAWVSGTGSVTVRYTNADLLNTAAPNAGSFRFMFTRF